MTHPHLTGKQFRAMREEMGLTRRELGIELGTDDKPIPARTIRSWEDGTYSVHPSANRIMWLVYKEYKEEEES